MTSEEHHSASEEHYPETSEEHHPVTSEEHHPARLRRQEKDSKYLRQIKSRNFLYLSVIMNRFVCASSAVNSSVGVPVFSSPRFFTPRISRARGRPRHCSLVENATSPGSISSGRVVGAQENCINQHFGHPEAELHQGHFKNYPVGRPYQNSFPNGESSVAGGESIHHNGQHNLVKLPTLWDTDQDLWFTTIENIFQLHRVTSERDRFELTLGALDLRHLQKIRCVIQDLHPDFPYSQVKQALTKAYSVPKREQLNELLYHTSLKDRRPTKLLAHMRELLGTRDSPELLEKLFMDKLPSDVRRIVVASRAENLDNIAERADRVLAEDTSAIRTINSRNRTQSESPDLTLHKKVDSLAESFNQMALAQESIFRTPNSCHTQPNCNTHYNTRTLFSSTPRLPPANRSLGPNNYHQPRNPSTSCLTPRSTTREPGYCYYHAKFGPSARNCQTPCSWNQTASCSRNFRSPQSRNTVNPLSDDDGPFPSDLLFIKDPLNDLNFMIDTGSSRSLLPCDLSPDQTKAKGKMFAAKGSEVTLFETVHLIVSLGVGRHLPWQFTRANVRFPVIGMDFLRHYGLIVDTVKQCLRNATTIEGEEKKKPQNPDAVILLSKILTLTLNQSLTMRLSKPCLSPPPLKSICTLTHACLIYLITPDRTDTKPITILKLQAHPCFLAYEDCHLRRWQS